MAVKLIANYSKRLGLPGYSSHQFSVTVESELHNTDNVSLEAARLYKTLQMAVDKEIQSTGFVPDEAYGINQAAPTATKLPVARRDEPERIWRASDKQRDLIRKLVQDNSVEMEAVEELALEMFDNGTLAVDTVALARSLGFGAEIRVRYPSINSNRNRNKVVLRIYGENIGDIPVERDYFRIINKTCMKHKSATTYTMKLTELEVDDYYGFEIDGNRRFVLGDHTVTHNTVMALKIVSLLKKKTLILVHKEFLMNQWIERIEEFLPGARVGKIQASTCDIDNKDIVIGMIQTMYNKVFPQEVYSQFGLTIIDEVHRIGSEEFSKTLLKTITPYMLGISATVERKDKLTKLLYMFIGPKIHSMLRKQEDTVNVRGIEFVTNDEEFNEVERDWKGQPKYSTMISKICEFGPRRDFIVKVVRDLVKESPESQIMVLAHNRSLLTYLH
ncbi:MAG: DEAD/DEAH box helicase, partial [Proteobacteria bacterium]|nr:DEAD/DEAH box helicase [Pseudomonadota bacterium]